MKDKDKIVLEYTALIMEKMGDLLDPEEGEVNVLALHEDDNLTHFIHALANVVPNIVFNNLTGNNIPMLEFNHVANKLCFQYSELSNKENNGE